MGIKSRQIANETNRILTSELLAGRYPILSSVQELVASKFRDRPSGLPRFQARRIENKEISSADKYNEMIENLHEDLCVAFQESRYQGDRMMALADYYETEKLRINLQIRKLNRRIEVLSEKLEDRGLRTVIFDTFNDFLMLELDGDSARSLPLTDAFVDLRNGYAILDNIQSGNTKINLANAQSTVRAVTEFDDFVQLSKIEGALVDTINEAWRHKAILSEAGEAEVILKIELERPTMINIVSFTPQSPRPCTIVLKTSPTGESFKSQVPRTVGGFTEWNLEEEEIQYIEFHIKKMEPDIAQGAEYHYYFGAQNISFRHAKFINEALVVSKPHQVDRIVDKITLKVDEVIHPGTDIKYFIAEDKMDGSLLEWEIVEPGEKVLLDSLITKEVAIDNTSDAYGAFYQSLYNQDYHSIIKLEERPLERTGALYMGDAMWQVDYMPHTADTTFRPTIDTWKTIKEYSTTFVSMEHVSAGSEMAVSKGYLERMTLYVTMAQDYILLANPIDATGVNMSVYLNNTEIKGINGDYTYNFKKGLNKIEVIYYSPNGGKIAPNLSRIYLQSIGATDIYATNQALKQVDVYDLLNNTSKRDFGKFAISEDNKIIVNYNPSTMDRAGKGLRYRLQYRYPKDDTRKSTYLRFMARLSQENQDDLTPILNSYKLIIE